MKQHRTPTGCAAEQGSTSFNRGSRLATAGTTTTLAIAIVALACLVAQGADARPGGGQGYSGGGGHSSGGGSGGGDGAGIIIELLIRLIIYYPQVGIPLALIVVAIFVVRARHGSTVRSERWSSSGEPSIEAPAPRGSVDINALRARDPEFSLVLFEDFLYALYARIHTARSDPAAMASLAPYVAPASRQALLAREPTGQTISGVVIGAMRIASVKLGDDATRVELEFESNYTAAGPRGPQGYYVHERWTVERAASVLTRPREAGDAWTFRCPNCGAAFESTGDERCRFCKQEVGEGRFDWSVSHVRLLRQETRPPALTAEVAEQGTNRRTIFDPKVQAQHAALISDDPGAAPELIERRLRAIYSELNLAWTALDLKRIRPLVSDSLYNYLEYWISAYRNQGLRNVLEQMAVERVQIVKLTRDLHYDAITLRFWAAGLDYTVRAADNHRVSGSNTRKRKYSEYWTLIRGAKVRGAPRDPGTCPSCGAPSDKVSMAGTCEYCGAHLTRGEFDWVLSKIEQDESYRG